jgi:hypothetical protein
MKILFNYAHGKFYQSQINNTKSGYEVGKFDKVFQFSEKDFDNDYREQNKHILTQPRGAGYWMWKFYFAKRLLNDNTIPEGSYIFYVDSGATFINSIDSLIQVAERDNTSIMTFRLCNMAYMWTKRDAFILMDADEPKYTHTLERCGGYFLLKKNDESRKFIDECYRYSLDYRIITDAPNELCDGDYPGFIDHRHDQTILTVVSKKFNLYPYREPSQQGFTGDVDCTKNVYGEEGLKQMIQRLGPIANWANGRFRGESLNHYPPINIDNKSTYPTIVNLHRSPK